MGAVQKQHTSILLWFGFFTASFLVYYRYSSGDFSFLMVSRCYTNICTELESNTYNSITHIKSKIIIIINYY